MEQVVIVIASRAHDNHYLYTIAKPYIWVVITIIRTSFGNTHGHHYDQCSHKMKLIAHMALTGVSNGIPCHKIILILLCSCCT